ncbi:MAG TPA: hypothetical protein VIC55_01115 [Gemmatimonadaceae bacterium]
MHRRWYTRFGALLLAMWFVCYGTEPLAALHNCPMHDGTMGTMAMDANGTATSYNVPHGAQRHAPAHHTCTCMGDCSGAAFAFRGTGIAIALPGLPAPRVGPPASPAYVPIAAPYALPYPNGPPARA